MRLSRIRRWGLAAIFAGASALFAAVPAAPGVVNFVEGHVTLDGQPLSGSSVGSAWVQQDQTLDTAQGRAEILLTPGVFLRVGENSSVRMISPSLTETSVQLLRGSALVEVAQLHKQNDIRILGDGSQTALLKDGLYRFNADTNSVAVYDGKVKVMYGDQSVDLKAGHETNLSGPLVNRKFDRKQTEAVDPLYAWSQLRSDYLSEASAATSRTYVVANSGFFGSGWYWNPYWRTYAWLPGDSVFYSPFGYGYYSPYAYYGPTYYTYSPYRYYPRFPHTYRPGPRVIGPRGPISPGQFNRAPGAGIHPRLGRPTHR